MNAKPTLLLQPSEAAVTQAAAAIYAAYITAGKVAEGKQEEWMQRSIREALWIARATDEAVHSDTEMS